ncbi:Uncharacterized conserved protein, DUF58 family, contains vWF domain [Arthrobacter alpinus]|uniref:Uncharacterized conserved protein, DUF58 family, contains vWF domain n=1 Tax=Arthrobacter alpinus TaxID=656366 RepID=A0A1H5KLL2_9MICC|nr:DUF58 domain-containing protein [Arthrobacter alpinus]SEE65307.1 Uncharacterized conserved protein, DUF58 family, contains vWF domain [Arthrobacter alpinus]
MVFLRLFRPRGWILLAVGALALLLALVLGRRDLLTIAVFCCALPAVASAAVYLIKPGFTVKRTVTPVLGRVGSPVSVTLDVHGRTPGGGRIKLVEELPVSFRDVPTFTHPHPVVPRGLLSRYHYSLHPGHRGVFTIGPLRGQFSDPFDITAVQRGLDDGGRLAIAPAAVELPSISLTDGRGQDGSHSTPELAHASHDDAMTREYRYGDPLRRVHWPVTARQGKLMVRAEESVTTPEAALVIDRRATAFGESSKAMERFQIAGHSMVGLPELRTTVAFETAIVAAASIATHLLERGYLLRVLDHSGLPGFASSESAQDPGAEEYSGSQGVFDVAAALAALELNESTPTPQTPFANGLAHKLHEGRRRGPLVAVTGLLSEAEALLLADMAESTQSAFALILCQDPIQSEPALEVLRRAGWRATALTPAMHLEQAWLNLDQPAALTRWQG